ncbi:phage holin family protein [Stenotrophomonas rhizophila]|uniref:phage holin family protein n=1 Tax=Stenotrophomonas rhizophila TaxID=216778 RepID=UPI00351554FC
MADFINTATVMVSLAICIRLLTYRPSPTARHRPTAAWLAWALIVCTGGLALAMLLFGSGASGVAKACHLGLLVVLALVIYRARGNAARLLPED